MLDIGNLHRETVPEPTPTVAMSKIVILMSFSLQGLTHASDPSLGKGGNSRQNSISRSHEGSLVLCDTCWSDIALPRSQIKQAT